MISYALVMIVSLATGQATHASLEGPMSADWCAQLITQERYNGDDGTFRKSPACLNGEEARRILQDSLCTRRAGPSSHWPAIEYDCGTPSPAPVAAAEERAQDLESPTAPGEAPLEQAPETVAAGSAQPRPDEPSPAQPAVAEASLPPPAEPSFVGPQRRFHLGTAATALVTRAHAQASRGEYVLAAATIERALRIEPENPLLWIELGQVRMRDGNAVQADGIYRKALSLATGDSELQATAWILIAESLRTRGRNQEAAEAERRAASSVPR